MLTVERYDKKPEPRAEEIQRNWRAWARANNYTQKETLLVEAGEMGISLEAWEGPVTLEDNRLLYMPPIPRTRGGDILYITDQEYIDELIDTVKKLVLAALAMVQMQPERREERARLN